MKYRIIYLLLLPIIYFFIKWSYDIFSRYEELESKHVNGDFKDQFMCCLSIWIVILVGLSIILEGEYNIFSNLMKFLTKERTIKT